MCTTIRLYNKSLRFVPFLTGNKEPVDISLMFTYYARHTYS